MADVFVFGSNLAGRHGKGAALAALRHWGAIPGRGVGLQGQAYAIPTESTPRQSLTLDELRPHVEAFLEWSARHPMDRFLLTRVGCGLAGFTERQIAPLFAGASPNVVRVDESCQPLGPASEWAASLL